MNARTKAQDALNPVTESFTGWAKLNTEEQKVVKQETDAVIEARKMEGKSKAAIGQHLLKLKEILEPKRLFVSFIDFNFHMSRATAYRYMELAEVAEQILPAPILEAAMIRGTPIRREQIQDNPPPQTEEPKAIQDYLAKLEDLPQRKPIAAQETDEQVLMKEVVNFFRLRLARVEGTKGYKQRWAKKTLGMCASVAEIHTEFNLAPIDVPQEFIARVGRPSSQVAAA